MKIEPGTVIHGTHLARDLIPAFLEVLELLAGASEAHQMVWDHCGEPWNFEPVEGREFFDAMDWEEFAEENPDGAIFLLEDLFETLNDIAPWGYYFGAHPGNGSDYGFWEEGDL